MNEKKKVLFCILPAAAVAFVAIAGLAQNGKILTKAQFSNPAAGTWVHYAEKAPTATEFGVKEYWVNCGSHEHVLNSADLPEGAHVEEGESYDTSAFLDNDDRWNKELAPYQFVRGNTSTYCGATMFNVTANNDEVAWAMNGRLNDEGYYGQAALGYKAYGGNEFKWVLPKMNFKVYSHVYTTINVRVWTNDFIVGFSEAYLTDPSAVVSQSTSTFALFDFEVSGNQVNGLIRISGKTDITTVITDPEIISGQKSITLWAKAAGTGDVYFSCANFVCEAPDYNFINYGAITKVGRFSNNIQPILNEGGVNGTLKYLPTSKNYFPKANDYSAFALIHDSVENDSSYVATDGAGFSYGGAQIDFGDWWFRRVFDLHSSFWSDGDIVVIEGNLYNTEGFRINFLRSCIGLTVDGNSITGVAIVNA